MDLPPRAETLPLRHARQFSLRELLVLTFAASLILAIAVSSRGSTRFGALSSPWALAALSPIVAVLVVGRFQLASPRALAALSIAIYAASLCTPALGFELGSSSAIWGYQALHFSLWIFPELVSNFLDSWTFDRLWGPVVCLMGNLTNVAFVVSVILFFVGTKNPKAYAFCRRTALLGALMAIAVLTAFLFEGDIKVIYPGYGLWIASLLAMALAAKRARSPL
ncbi:MAG TPA: hypothetical protein VGK58_00160 [Lacipirellulaceae bacterium]